MDHFSVNMTLMQPEELPEAIREILAGSEKREACFEGWIYYLSGNHVFRCEDGENGRAMIDALRTESSFRETKNRRSDPWRDLLTGESGAAGIPGFQDHIPRCVILFISAPDQEDRFSGSVFSGIIPVERNDVVSEIKPGYVALVKQGIGLSEEDVSEFAAAAVDTIQTETGLIIQAGISRITLKLGEISECFHQALTAVRMGRKYRREDSLFLYAHQTAERMIDAMPPEARKKMRNELFSPEVNRLMNSEMMETVEAFLQNDLNVSTTARQLFIHRNTLIYRLDKIKKATGYDLRKFQDAADFSFLSKLPEC